MFSKRVVLLLSVLLGQSSIGLARLPTWELRQPDGDTVMLDSYQGRWLLVNIWASWCVTCLQEIPLLQRFHDSNPYQARVLGINMEDFDLDLLQEFMSAYQISYPLVQTAPAEHTPLGAVPALPISFLFSPEGELVQQVVGAVNVPVLLERMRVWSANLQVQPVPAE